MNSLKPNHFDDTGIGITCSWCHNALCAPSSPCRCCLIAEVEALKGENAALTGMVEKATASLERVKKARWRSKANQHPDTGRFT